ncbi:MAG: SET domain-containing protein [Thaumarchaeota archaeon]|nr:SET domain-containing protein [Nitrososphaerota archaeon]
MTTARDSETVPGVLEVRSCPHGRGVFALRDFREGDTVSIVVGGEFTANPRSTDGHALRIGDSLYWDEVPVDSPIYWSNFLDHNGDPNCRFVDFDPSMPGARLVAVSTIRKGEEMFLDYRDYHPENPVF